MWPFILKTRLNSDLIIGIDVKHNTAGFTVVHQSGEKLTFYESTSEQKEKLSRDHIRKQITDIIAREQKLEKRGIKNIVIHRQGTLFPSEERGVQDALNILVKRGAIESNYTCTFVELRTTSRVPFRLFRIEDRPGSQGDYITNPSVGTYQVITSDEAFLCNTGLPYRHGGTTNPLHVLKHGHLSIKEVIEDVFYLTNLTWTKIDDCSRLPITVKMADIRLRETAGEYDSDAFRFEEK
jgi:argonaute-like protein implicated in RNA metabolism and viral defense